MNDEKLQLLHDHYKDTFTLIRDRERQRDRLFLVVLGLYGVLAVAVLFSVSFSAALKNAEVAGVKADLSTLPAGVVLGALWAFSLAMTLRYCQVSIVVERQYEYLHTLEAHISKELGGGGLYQREGRAYLERYPAFSAWAWASYTYVFPLLLILVAVAFIVTEWLRIRSGWAFKTLDTALGFATCTTLVLYRFMPVLRRIRAGPEARSVAAND